MAPVTEKNPTGIETFDHSRISALPEYAEVSSALDRLVKATDRARDRRQAGWLQVVQQMASALPYTNTCETCRRASSRGARPGTGRSTRRPAPDGAEVRDGWVSGRYVCPRCGTRWACGYAVDVPRYDAPTATDGHPRAARPPTTPARAAAGPAPPRRACRPVGGAAEETEQRPEVQLRVGGAFTAGLQSGPD